MAEILNVKNLSVSFDTEVIDSLTFSLEKGDCLAVIGPNGAGKTVLLRALMRTIPYSGEISWLPGARIGYVPQKIDADRHLPINFRNILEAKAKIFGMGKTDIEKTIAAADLDEKILRTPVGHLSGGQFQRGLIAFALLGRPNVILFDEPTASIDIPGEEKIYELIHRLQDEYGISVVLVSHDLSFVYRYATKVLCLNKSGVCFGPPEEALTPQMLQNLYGGPMKYYHHLHAGEH